MSVPTIQFPVAYDDIPAETKKLIAFIRERDAERNVACKLLQMIQNDCPHTGAKTGYNERDGHWMNPCPHCGDSK